MISEHLGVDTVLELQRRFPSPREKVFRAWTDPGELKKWWGPAGYETPEVEVDLRVGGRYRLAMRKAPDGEIFYLNGAYQEVTPPERLVYTWSWEGNQMDSTETLVTVEFRDLGDETEVRLTHERFPNKEQRDRHIEGWTSCLERLGGAA